MAINPEIKDRVKVGEEWIDDYFLTTDKNQELKDLRTDLTQTQDDLQSEVQRAEAAEQQLDEDKVDKDFTEKVLTEIKHTAQADGVHLTKTKVSPSTKVVSTEEVILPQVTQSTAGFASPRDKFIIDDAVIKNSDDSISNTQIINSDVAVSNTHKYKVVDANNDEYNAINQTTQMEFGDVSVHTHLNTNADNDNHITVTTPQGSEVVAYKSDVEAEKSRAEAREQELQNDIDSNSDRIQSLEGRSVRYAVSIPDNATQEQLQAIFEQASGEPQGSIPNDGTRLVDVDKNVVYTYFASDNTWHGPESDTVSTASNDRLGIVKGSTSIYKIRVNSTTGEMTLNVNDGSRDKVLSDNNFTDAQVTKLANISDTIVGLTKDQIGLVDDVLVDGSSVLENKVAKIVNATQTKAGSMSSSDKIKLDGIESGAQVNLIESITANGNILDISNKNVTLPVPDLANESKTVTNQNDTTPVKYWSGTKAEWDAAVASGIITDSTTWDITDDMVDPINVAQVLLDDQNQVPSSHAVYTALQNLSGGSTMSLSQTDDIIKVYSTSDIDYDADSQLGNLDSSSLYVVEGNNNIELYKNGKTIKLNNTEGLLDKQKTINNITSSIDRDTNGYLDLNVEGSSDKSNIKLKDNSISLSTKTKTDNIKGSSITINNGSINIYSCYSEDGNPIQISSGQSFSIKQTNLTNSSGIVVTNNNENGTSLSYAYNDNSDVLVNSVIVNKSGVKFTIADGNTLTCNGKEIATVENKKYLHRIKINLNSEDQFRLTIDNYYDSSSNAFTNVSQLNFTKIYNAVASYVDQSNNLIINIYEAQFIQEEEEIILNLNNSYKTINLSQVGYTITDEIEGYIFS